MLEVSLRALVRRLSPYCRQALSSAAEGCIERGNYEIAVEHLMLALLNEPNHDVQTVFRHFNVDGDRVLAGLHRQIESTKSGRAERPVYSGLLIDWFKESWLLASVEYGDTEVRSGALLLAMVLNPQIVAQLDAEAELDLVSAERLRSDLRTILEDSAEPVSETTDSAAPGSRDSSTREGTPLDLYTQDFTAQARAGDIDPVFCRDNEIRQLIDILCRRRKNNPLAVGEAGVGKSAFVEGLALKIAEGDVPESLANVDLLALDLQAMQAGASVRGEFEKRLKAVIEGVKSSPKPIILFIDEVHTLIGAGGQAGTGDAANILKPALARGELRTIAATTWAEYKKYIEKDAALARRFQLVTLEEPSPEQATIIMRGLRHIYEEAHDVYIRDDAVIAAAEMSARYISGRQLPDKCVDVLDTASARVKLSLSTKPAALDDMEKKVRILEREMNAIARDIETGISQADGRVVELQDEIVQLQADHAVLEERWQREKTLANRVLDIRRSLKQQAVGVVDSADANAESTSDEALANGDDAGRDAVLENRGGETDESEAVASKSPAELKTELAALTTELADIQQGDPLVSHEASPDIVAQIIADWTGIPLGRMVRDQAASVLRFGEELRQRIKGQDHAIEQIDRGIRASKAGIASPDGPIGVFLLVGPSGVGKTETALGVADLMFGGERFVTTVNMSEFMERHAVSRLIGSPPGYVDSDRGGMLTESVRQRPYSVVLLDEVEKAHPEVMNLFYQVFDKGDLTDGQNLTVNFRNTIVFLTSNLTSDQILAKWQQNREIDVEELLEEIRPTLSEHLKPALLGRMQVIPFFPLDDNVLRDIVDLKLAKLTTRLQVSQHIDLQYSPAVADQIVARCREVESGARNIDSVIGNTLVPTIATEVLGHLGEEHMPERLIVDLDSNGDFSYTFS